MLKNYGNIDLRNLLRYDLFFMLIFIASVTCCSTVVAPVDNEADYKDFNSYADFRQTLSDLGGIVDETERTTRINTFWDSLAANHQVPFALGDSVAFLYKKAASKPFWAGDFNGWNPSWQGRQVGLSDVYMFETVFPSDARLDYKIVDDSRWLLDPANPYRQYGGFGANSELRMPDWVYPEETNAKENVPKGSLSNNILIYSTNLSYTVQYKVYTPFNYDNEAGLPVIYVADGQDYADDKLGAMVIVLDNLIFEGLIKPVIAVFIDPRNPDKLADNRRASEYRSNIKYANFVADELVSAIDSQYKTSTSADDRAILGASYGGWNASYFGLTRNDKFHLIGIHSPSTSQSIIDGYANSSSLPIKVFMSTGVINDTQVQARALKSVLEQKGYPLQYIEVNQGHSWGNWRGLLKQPLTYFFAAGG